MNIISPDDLDYVEIREAVRAICGKFRPEYWRQKDKEEAYPTEFIEALTAAGFLGALIPEEYGGTGLPLRAAAVILEEICATGCVAAPGHAQMYIMGTLLRHGSEAQKERYLPGIASGELRLQAFGVTEPTSGSDTTSIKTFARKTAGGYIVNGQKVWTSRAEHSDLMLLLARTTKLEDVQKRSEGISVFLVDLRTAKKSGLEIHPIEAMVNHHTTEVFIENLFIADDCLIGEEGSGFRYILDGMNAERVLTSAEGVGTNRWFIEKATDYANERVVFGRPIGKNQAIQFPIARAFVQGRAADLMVRRAAEKFDNKQPCGPEANMARLLASEAGWEAAEACLQVYGGFGFAREYDIERRWREARLARTAPVSTNLILSYVAQHVLGLPRSY